MKSHQFKLRFAFLLNCSNKGFFYAAILFSIFLSAFTTMQHCDNVFGNLHVRKNPTITYQPKKKMKNSAIKNSTTIIASTITSSSNDLTPLTDRISKPTHRKTPFANKTKTVKKKVTTLTMTPWAAE